MPAKIWPLIFWKLDWWQQWFRVSTSTQNLAILNPRQIYIFPTRWGLLYAVMLIGLLIGSINYSLSLGFYVTFLLASLGNIAILHTWRNLLHLQVSILKVNPVFAGKNAEVTIQITDSNNRARYAIYANFPDHASAGCDIAANETALLSMPFRTATRGRHTLPRLTLHTQFPLNLLRAWAVIENPFPLLVYAKPAESMSEPVLSINANVQGSSHIQLGDEDFNGHKNYQFGDPPSRVDWKASSRSIGMFTKVYSGTGNSVLWLDWENCEGDVETRISQLTRQVIESHASQQLYGVKLPGTTFPPNNSEAHYQQALTALALL